MSYPLLSIDLFKIQANASFIVEGCHKLKIETVGVVKCCQGNPEIAKAMLLGGVKAIADSRLENLKKLNKSGISPLMMLRSPMQSEIRQALELAEYFLISDLSIARLLLKQAIKIEKKPKLILMVELGDGREGFNPNQILPAIKELNSLINQAVFGIGTNVACLEGVPPTASLLRKIVKLRNQAEQELLIKIPLISGGNSSAWNFIYSGDIPDGVKQLRIGEAILLGQETINYEPIKGTYQDAFHVSAEVLESREKIIGDKLNRVSKRAVLAIGKQELGAGQLKPLDQDIHIRKVSSDHLVVEFKSKTKFEKLRAGDTINFIPDYFALLGLYTCQNVQKKYWSSQNVQHFQAVVK